MANAFNSFLSIVKQVFSSASAPVKTSIPQIATRASIKDLFPKVDKEIDGESCDHDCHCCVVKFPKGFKIDEDDQLYGQIKEFSTHMLVATGKSDWAREISDEAGSVMEAIKKNTDIQPRNGRLMLSASNMPIPSQGTNYEAPTSVLLLPAWLIIENVTPKSVNTLISEYVNEGPTTSTELKEISIPKSLPDSSVPEQLNSRPCPHSALILLCSQGTRDARCGQSAPLLRKEFERHLREFGLYRNLDDDRPGGVGIYFISHVGGHKYAANVIIYRLEDAFGIDPIDCGGNMASHSSRSGEDIFALRGAAQCIWLARVRPEDCEGIIKYTVLQGKLVKPERQLRGGFDRRRRLLSW